MRKALEIIGTLLVVVLVWGMLTYCETHYVRYAHVSEIHGEEIVVEDMEGNTWTFYGDGYEINDNLKLKMVSKPFNNDYTLDEIVDAEVLEHAYVF